MIPIDGSHFLLATARGLLRTTKDQVVIHYYENQTVRSVCHFADSLYLVGLVNEDMVALWNEQTDQQLLKISEDLAWSIKRVPTTGTFILKTQEDGLKLLTITDFTKHQFSLTQGQLQTKEVRENPSDSLQVLVTADSHIVVATTQNEKVGGTKCKRTIKMLKIEIAGK